MKGSCEIGVKIESTEVASHHVTTNPQDSAPWRAKTSGVNVLFLVVLMSVLVMPYMLILIDRNEQNSRIEAMEAQLRLQRDLIKELQGSLKLLGDHNRHRDVNDGEYGRLDTTDALEGRKTVPTLREQAELKDDVTKTDQGPSKQAFLKPGKPEPASSTNLYRNGNTERNKRSSGRIKRTEPTTTATTAAAPTRRRKKNPRSERNWEGKSRRKGNRARNENRESLTCDLVRQCNGTVGKVLGETSLVAHFELENDSDNLVGAGCVQDEFNPHYISCDDEIIGGWNHASWMSHHEVGHRDFRIRGRGRPSRAKIEVRQPGIYFVYSQVTFSDNGSYLAYAIMLDDVPKFSCRLFVHGSVVDSNSCWTGGLMKIEAGQVLHIQLVESNKVISMDRESTFFGLTRMFPLDA